MKDAVDCKNILEKGFFHSLRHLSLGYCYIDSEGLKSCTLEHTEIN